VNRAAAPALDLNFGTKNIGYYDSWRVYSDNKNYPSLTSPTSFTLSGTWNPTARRDNGSQGNSGTIAYGTQLQVDAPAVGQTRVVQITVNGQTGSFTVVRAANP
jgi:hypothetical protein